MLHPPPGGPPVQVKRRRRHRLKAASHARAGARGAPSALLLSSYQCREAIIRRLPLLVHQRRPRSPVQPCAPVWGAGGETPPQVQCMHVNACIMRNARSPAASALTLAGPYPTPTYPRVREANGTARPLARTPPVAGSVPLSHLSFLWPPARLSGSRVPCVPLPSIVG